MKENKNSGSITTFPETACTTQWSCHISSCFFNPSLKKNTQKATKGHVNYSLSFFSPISYKRVPATFCNIIFPLLFQLFCHDLCTAATIPQQNSKNNGLPV